MGSCMHWHSYQDTSFSCRYRRGDGFVYIPLSIISSLNISIPLSSRQCSGSWSVVEWDIYWSMIYPISSHILYRSSLWRFWSCDTIVVMLDEIRVRDYLLYYSSIWWCRLSRLGYSSVVLRISSIRSSMDSSSLQMHGDCRRGWLIFLYRQTSSMSMIRSIQCLDSIQTFSRWSANDLSSVGLCGIFLSIADRIRN